MKMLERLIWFAFLGVVLPFLFFAGGTYCIWFQPEYVKDPNIAGILLITLGGLLMVFSKMIDIFMERMER